MYRVQRVSDIHAWLDQETRWNAFAGESPFQQWAWQATWWTHFGSAYIPYFLVVFAPNHLPCAFVPWTLTKARRRVVQFVGSGPVCSDGLSIHCHSQHAAGVGKAVADWLVDRSRDREDGWHELNFEGVNQGDVPMMSLVRQLERRGIWCQTQTRMNRWFLPTSQSLEQYLAEFGKTRRRQFRQHLERLHSYPKLSYNESTSSWETDRDLNSLIDLHQKRWNAIGQQGSFANPSMRQFIHETAQLLMLRKQLRLVTLKHAGEPIASQLQLVALDGSLLVYSSGMSLQHAELEPGRLLDASTIDYAIAKQLPGIDYLRGDEPYKANLHAQPTPIVQIKGFSKRRFSQLERVLYQSTFEAKQWVRKRRGKALIQVLKDAAPHAPSTHAVLKPGDSPSPNVPQTVITIPSNSIAPAD